MTPVVDGAIVDCPKCGRLACVCEVKRVHAKDCPFQIAVSCAVAIECEHGYDVCPKCDPCTCGTGDGVGIGA